MTFCGKLSDEESAAWLEMASIMLESQKSQFAETGKPAVEGPIWDALLSHLDKQSSERRALLLGAVTQLLNTNLVPGRNAA